FLSGHVGTGGSDSHRLVLTNSRSGRRAVTSIEAQPRISRMTMPRAPAVDPRAMEFAVDAPLDPPPYSWPDAPLLLAELEMARLDKKLSPPQPSFTSW